MIGIKILSVNEFTDSDRSPLTPVSSTDNGCIAAWCLVDGTEWDFRAFLAQKTAATFAPRKQVD